MSAVVFVCTANLCRSPIAEHLFRARLAETGVTWDVTSAGTQVKRHARMHDLSEAVLAEHSIKVAPRWRSEALTAATARDAPLILAATHAHLQQTLALAPQVARRAFVLSQFARLLAAAPDSARCVDAAGLIDLAARSRTLVQPRPSQADDLDDPIGGSLSAFRTCAETIDRSLVAIVAHLSDRDAPTFPRNA